MDNKKESCYFILIFILILSAGGESVGDSCHSRDADPYRMFSTHTPYALVRGNISSEHTDIPGCAPSMIYVLSRHGSRYQKGELVSSARDFIYSVRDFIVNNPYSGRLCPEDRHAIQDWVLRQEPIKDHFRVGKRGRKESFELAQRLKQRFGRLLKKRPADDVTFLFKSSQQERTETALKAFAGGLFYESGMDWARLDDVVKQIKYEKDEETLRFWRQCPRWSQTVGKIFDKEQKKFQKGPEWKNLLEKVKARIGWPNYLGEKVDFLYDICRADFALFRDSPFCAVFSDSNLKVLEYNEDLKFYWRDTHPLSANISCPLIKDIMQTLREGTKKVYPDRPIGVFRFSHTSALTLLFAKLGLYVNPTQLLASNYERQGNRTWRTSTIAPYGGNILLVMYKCADKARYKLRAWVNERVVEIPGCKTNPSHSCDMGEIERLWGKLADQCDFKTLCSANTGSLISTSLTAVFFGVATYFSLSVSS